MGIPETLQVLFPSVFTQARDDKTSYLVLIAAAIGIATISSYVTSFGKVLLDLARTGDSLNKYGAKRGAWAVVTGCTSGIGREFALQLAKAGFKIVLVSRNEQSLKQLQGELATESRIVAIDFANATPEAYKNLENTIKSIDAPIGVLVNNVGVSHAMPVDFHECSDKEMDDIIEINCRANLRVTKMVLPNMLSAKKGLILNIGSFAALTSSPMLAPYAGSKNFLYAWSQALGGEYAKKGIKVQLLNTFFVVSNLSKIRKPNWQTPTPKAYVKAALSHIGLSCGAVGHPYVSTPYWSHAIIQWVVDHIGTRWNWLNYTHRLHIDIRRRALKKQERERKAAGKTA